jgi:hypothetical protein
MIDLPLVVLRRDPFATACLTAPLSLSEAFSARGSA